MKCIVRSEHINGLPATKIHLDTGSSMTLIHRKFSSQCDSSGQFVQMRNTTGTQTYPVVKAKIELDGHSYETDVAVSKQFQEDALLRMDLPLMKHLIYAMNSEEKQTAREQLGPSETSYPVTTRAQAQQQKTQKEKYNPSIGTQKEKYNPSIREQFPFDNSFLDTGRKDKEYQTRAQKRVQRKHYQTTTLSNNELIELQNKDPEIQQWEQYEQPQFKVQISGVLCQRWGPRDKPAEIVNQVVLPQQYRKRVLKLAHDVPMAGHLGRGVVLGVT